ncbi:tRNA (Adenine-N(1)-)-methyltransferase non-catalytic subunit trm6 [Scedosporium apiospermum]|uniref:tRNA (adenine(58)-N(1))-methyltransferase non-catalytic subunit TRM6 n=1 Tax=Pseudallescheria apiosperma TaxID=563466 RepID=A0A084GFZ1_PSEDA|nr:tRNA (Adenine-N(1)-)-methyltransferase non-catalytic subunit trm6 [Scedosporium apiospermum]KEZ46253.1 tRNA (Adenine-N(1)-)-methyltransferase non-catalytic subunit trm6 [Scedosporium apiospermum]
MGSVVLSNEWAGFKLPSGAVKVIQVIPNTIISLGKYGSFPSNLVIDRPYHLTYEVQDKRPDETFCRLRIVPAHELRADILADVKSKDAPENGADGELDEEEANAAIALAASIVAQDDAAALAASASTDKVVRQTLTADEIEALKRDGTSAGKDLIAKLLSSHTALDEKTAYSLEKYKLLKTKKYIRRFEVLPLDTPLLTRWLLEDRDGMKILELREEMLALLGCWANIHCAAADEPEVITAEKAGLPSGMKAPELTGGRWLVVDDTGGLLVAAMAERMGILHPHRPTKKIQQQRQAKADSAENNSTQQTNTNQNREENAPADVDTAMADAIEVSKPEADGAELAGEQKIPETETAPTELNAEAEASKESAETKRKAEKSRPRPYDRDDLEIPYAGCNTMTLIHSNSQPNLSFLKYYDFNFAAPNPPFASHPLHTNLLWLNWLQLLEPDKDAIYATEPPAVSPDELQTWKGNRRGVYHRKRRRWARTRFIVDSTRAGGFSGLVTASTLDPISLLRHTLPLLAPGAPIAIYSQSVEPLTQLADCFSVARRAAWATDPPPEAEGQTPEELERWPGSEDFPINPGLLLGTTVQTSRVRQWQVLPGRTHPHMTSRGGSEGYIFTAWKALPAVGRVEARGRHKRRKTTAAVATPTSAEG